MLFSNTRRTDLAFGEVNYQFLLDYEHYLKTKRGCAHNSAMKRMRELKKIIRLGVKLDLIKKNPFDSYTITYDNTEREILNEQDLNKLRSSGIKSRRLSIIRDLFHISMLYWDFLRRSIPAETRKL